MNNKIVIRALEMFLDGKIIPPPNHKKALRRFIIEKAIEYNYKHDYILSLAFGLEGMIEIKNKINVDIDIDKCDSSMLNEYDIPLNIDLGLIQKKKNKSIVNCQILRSYNHDSDILFDDRFLVKIKLMNHKGEEFETENYIPASAIIR